MLKKNGNCRLFKKQITAHQRIEHRTSATAVLKMMMQPCKTFVYKHTVDLESIQMNKKKENGEFTRHQVTSN